MQLKFQTTEAPGQRDQWTLIWSGGQANDLSILIGLINVTKKLAEMENKAYFPFH